MAKKTSISAADMEAVFGHAVVQPKARTGEGQTETRAESELGVVVLGSVRTAPALKTWRVRGKDGKPAALVTLADSTTPPERERVARALVSLFAVRDNLKGTLPVRQVTDDHDAFLTDLWTTGTAKDLSALKWPLRKRVEFVAAVVRTLGRLHAAGLVHGCLCADNVLLDDDLDPVLSEAGLVDVRALIARRDALAYEPFAAPELKSEDPTPSGDLYSVGRLLQELVSTEEKVPPNVSEIVQRCVSPPKGRYVSAGELVAALEAAASELALAEQTKLTPDLRPAAAAERKERAPAPDAAGNSPPTPSEPWQPPTWLGVGGIVMVAGALAAGAFLGGTNELLRPLLVGMVPLGAALATTLAPPLPKHGTVARIAFALGLAGIALVFDPLSLAFRIAAHAHVSKGGEDSRRMAVGEILRMGRDFRGVSLAGANLANLDMTGADLRGVNLVGADLTGTRLVAAEVDGANLDGAQLASADLSATQLQLAVLGSARCDETTRLPTGFRCDAGHVTRNQPSPAP
jgi:hypothetical protein